MCFCEKSECPTIQVHRLLWILGMVIMLESRKGMLSLSFLIFRFWDYFIFASYEACFLSADGNALLLYLPKYVPVYNHTPKLHDSYHSRISHLSLVYNLWTFMSASVIVLVDAYAPILFTNASFVIILFKKNSVCHYHCLLCHTLFFLMNFDAFLISKWRTLHL